MMSKQPLPNKKDTHAAPTNQKEPLTRNATKPGGPILPGAQGYRNPGATPNLRGVEPNTEVHKGTPNPHQEGTAGHHGTPHNPGMEQASNPHGHGVPTPIVDHKGAAKHHSAPLPTPMPGNYVPEGAA